MKDDIRDQRRVFRWALPASVVVHSLVAALLVFGLPVSLSQPQKEEAITVDLVPPPEPPEKAKVDPSPSAEESRSEKSQEAKVEEPSPTSAARHEPSPGMRPVFQFGEKDAGPRESPDGNSAEDGSESPTASREPDKEDMAEPPAVTALEAMNRAPKPGAPETPAPKPADVAKAQKPLKLQEAKTLFSRAATGDPIATTAMGNLPRGVRAGQLCVTELGGQLANASPPYFVELAPFHPLDDGTVLEQPEEAFRANGQWYNVSYRCEVDKDATKVVAFAFRVGDPIPRSEWKRRRPPLR